MGRLKCDRPSCAGASVETDPSGSTTCCTGCGRVLEENATVNEVTFMEGGQGQALLVGQHVGTDGKVYAGLRLPGETGDESASFLRHGRQDIYTLKNALQLKRGHADEAVSLFKLAVQRGFVKGRKIMHVSCACLYFVCRMMRSPHMLIDFSEVVKTNVFKLGAVFMQLARLTNIRLELVDPSLYIHRFVGQLEFESKAQVIANTSLRLIARMKRDWMVTGRRPSGLCGAAIIIACRMHDFYRSKERVMKVVRVCQETLAQRLREFRDTSAKYLTRDEIDQMGGDDGSMNTLKDLETVKAEDPPCLKAKRRKLEAALKRQRLKRVAEETDADESSCEEEIREEASRLEVTLATRSLLALSVPASQRDINDFGDVDEEDLLQYLNTQEETEIKTRIWEAANQDYLEKEEALRRLREENPAEFKRRFPWKVALERKRSREESPQKPAENAAEAASQALEKKSNKINYDVLRTMFGNKNDDEKTADESVLSSVTNDAQLFR